MVQMKLPLDVGVKIDPNDQVVTFKEVMEGVNLKKYLSGFHCPARGRNGYDPVTLLKIVLFAYMNNVRSTRKIEELCKYDIRFMYLSDELRPSHMTICTFINKGLMGHIEDIFNDITKYILEKENIDISTIFIDGTKMEAFSNKYTWVWKKACITSRDRKFRQLKEYFTDLNNKLLYLGQPEFPVKDEYEIKELDDIVQAMEKSMSDNGIEAAYGKGKRKTPQQRIRDHVDEVSKKLKEYAEKIEICGEGRNSFSKTDKDATFMRMKTDYMGNTALLPAYNWQVCTAGEVIVTALTSQSANDSTCFVTLMEKYLNVYGEYPKCVVADAGYGTLATYDYCEKNEIEKFMKFPSWKRETHDMKFHNDPFRSRNFEIDEEGNPVCPNGKKFIKLYDKHVGNPADHRTEEQYVCENCEGCPLREKCFKGKNNRRININKTLTKYHEEVIGNLASEEGIRLRTIRSWMAEGTFGISKQDYNFRRLTRVSLEKVNMEFYLIMIGYNLKKYHNLKYREKPEEMN